MAISSLHRPFPLLGLIAVIVLPLGSKTLRGQEPPTRQEVKAEMKRAAVYFLDHVAKHGGYVYFYSEDLQERWGEGVATDDQIWVQPPGTPSVGEAYLIAYRATGDPFYRDAALAAALALRAGQLESGGWSNCIDFDPQGTRVGQYRQGSGRGRNVSSLDDDQTPAALRFLMRCDAALDFSDPQLHESIEYGLEALLAAQLGHGGFPQIWRGPVTTPVSAIPADFPDGSTEALPRVKNYWDQATLNDGIAGNVAEVLILADRLYEDPRFLQSLRRLGDFLLLAQLPYPQPAWAQQYDAQMHPIWARKFEPAAIASHESQDVIATLLRIHEVTGEPRFLKPIPSALNFLEAAQLDERRLARFYELGTNRPLYMIRDGDRYTLTYDDSDLPEHYGWKIPSRVAMLRERYQAHLDGSSPSTSQPSVDLARVRELLATLDEQGRWLSTSHGERLVGDNRFAPGSRYLSSDVFRRNLEQLASYLERLPTSEP